MMMAFLTRFEHSQCLNALPASATFKIIPVLISEGTFYLLLVPSAGTFPGHAYFSKFGFQNGGNISNEFLKRDFCCLEHYPVRYFKSCPYTEFNDIFRNCLIIPVQIKMYIALSCFVLIFIKLMIQTNS